MTSESVSRQYYFDYLGCSTLPHGSTGLGSVQRILRRLYFRYRHEQKKSSSPSARHPSTLVLSTSSLAFTLSTRESASTTMVEYPLHDVMFWDTVQFVSIQDETKPGIKACFESLQMSVPMLGMKTNHLYRPLSSQSAYLHLEEHVPLFICILRRQEGLRVPECHAFSCSALADALHLTSTLHSYQEQSTRQVPVGSGVFQYKAQYQGIPVTKHQLWKSKKQTDITEDMFYLQDRDLEPSDPVCKARIRNSCNTFTDFSYPGSTSASLKSDMKTFDEPEEQLFTVKSMSCSCGTGRCLHKRKQKLQSYVSESNHSTLLRISSTEEHRASSERIQEFVLDTRTLDRKKEILERNNLKNSTETGDVELKTDRVRKVQENENEQRSQGIVHKQEESPLMEDDLSYVLTVRKSKRYKDAADKRMIYAKKKKVPTATLR